MKRAAVVFASAVAVSVALAIPPPKTTIEPDTSYDWTAGRGQRHTRTEPAPLWSWFFWRVLVPSLVERSIP